MYKCGSLSSLLSHQSAVHVCNGRANQPVRELLPRLPLACPQIVDVRLQLLCPRTSAAFIHRVDVTTLLGSQQNMISEKRQARTRARQLQSRYIQAEFCAHEAVRAKHVLPLSAGRRRGGQEGGVDPSTTRVPRAQQTTATASKQQWHVFVSPHSTRRKPTGTAGRTAVPGTTHIGYPHVGLGQDELPDGRVEREAVHALALHRQHQLAARAISDTTTCALRVQAV